MPFGVEHHDLRDQDDFGRGVPDPVMPFGVEHQEYLKAKIPSATVPDPVMPFGVEHSPMRLMSSAIDSCPTP